MAKILANLVLFLHFCYVFYILLGILYIILGAFFKWSGSRNPVFRWTHLGAMGIVIIEIIFGIFCPLTELEAYLRQLGNDSFFYPNGFLAQWIHRIIYWDWPIWLFNGLYFVLFILIISLFLVFPPHRKVAKRNLKI